MISPLQSPNIEVPSGLQAVTNSATNEKEINILIIDILNLWNKAGINVKKIESEKRKKLAAQERKAKLKATLKKRKKRKNKSAARQAVENKLENFLSGNEADAETAA
ncbi:MAG: hypothetical protein ACPG3Z_06210, partial [Saprospiraceae bacterium]